MKTPITRRNFLANFAAAILVGSQADQLLAEAAKPEMAPRRDPHDYLDFMIRDTERLKVWIGEKIQASPFFDVVRGGKIGALQKTNRFVMFGPSLRLDDTMRDFRQQYLAATDLLKRSAVAMFNNGVRMGLYDNRDGYTIPRKAEPGLAIVGYQGLSYLRNARLPMDRVRIDPEPLRLNQGIPVEPTIAAEMPHGFAMLINPLYVQAQEEIGFLLNANKVLSYQTPSGDPADMEIIVRSFNDEREADPEGLNLRIYLSMTRGVERAGGAYEARVFDVREYSINESLALSS